MQVATLKPSRRLLHNAATARNCGLRRMQPLIEQSLTFSPLCSGLEPEDILMKDGTQKRIITALPMFSLALCIISYGSSEAQTCMVFSRTSNKTNSNSVSSTQGPSTHSQKSPPCP
jgi:hypothetical protein